MYSKTKLQKFCLKNNFQQIIYLNFTNLIIIIIIVIVIVMVQEIKEIILLSILFIFASSYCTDQIYCFKKSLFKFDYPAVGFYELNTITNEYQTFNQLNILAYGDFNGDLMQIVDQYSTDFVATKNEYNQSFSSATTTQLSVYIWSADNSNFAETTTIHNDLCIAQTVYLYDINNDGLLDITIFGNLAKGGIEKNCLVPYLRQNTKLLYIAGKMLNFTTSSNPTFFSFGTGKQKNIIYGLLYFSNVTGNRNYAVYEHGFLNQYVVNQWNSTFLSNQNSSFLKRPFSDPHWNSFLDITGDCKSDLVLIDSDYNIQIWINRGSKFIYEKSIKAGDISSLSFSDLNYDGTPDMIVGLSAEIQVYYNKMKLNDSSDFCRNDFVTFELNEPTTIMKFENDPQKSVITMDKQILHVQDIDINGYPDILMYLKKYNFNWIKNYQLSIPNYFLNYETKFENNTNLYGFNIQNEKKEPLIGDIISVSFIDFLQNGILDVEVVMKTEDDQYRLYSFYNNRLQQNSFFVKGFGASGSSDSGCQLTGVSFLWVNSISDSIRCAFQPQIIQTAYNALQLPFGYSGLGRANNYVQSFTMGMYNMSRSWSPIIPNSQLAVYASGSAPSQWEQEYSFYQLILQHTLFQFQLLF